MASPPRRPGYRRVVLAAGTFGQTAYASIGSGLAVLAPALREWYHVGLAQVGLVLAAPTLGSIGTFYLWGLTADRVGERIVLAAGLGTAAGCLVGAAFASSFTALVILLALAGGLGASASASTGRAVMHWFDARERGLALGIRQTSVPIAGTWAALVLPAITGHRDARTAILALAAVCAAASVCGLAFLREGPIRDEPAWESARPSPVRDRNIWLLSGASALASQPQACLVGFLVLFLHSHRGLSTADAAAVLATLNVLGIGGRLAAGKWSDVVGSRLRPFRLISLAVTVLVVCSSAVLSAPLWVLLPVLVVTGCVSMSWNGLSFAAVAEMAGTARSGTAVGLQQTALAVAGSLFPVGFGALVGAASWRAGFAVSAVFPLAGWLLLRRLSTSGRPSPLPVSFG